MKIGLLQSAPLIGAIKDNAHQLLKLMDLDTSCDLYVAPELSLMGYPPRDLLSFPDFIDLEKQYLNELIHLSLTKNFSLLLGHTIANPHSGKSLYNGASLISKGQVIQSFFKKRNPSYDVFDEERFFQTAAPNQKSFIHFEGKKLGIAICEDSWDSVRAFGMRDIRRYTPGSNPFFQLQDANILINLSASPFALHKKSQRHALMNALSGKHQCPLFYCNQVGAQDHLLFDGGSFVVDQKSSQIIEAPIFECGIFSVDWKDCKFTTQFLPLKKSKSVYFTAQKDFTPDPLWESLLQALCCGIKDYVDKTKQSKVLLGLSGGIDSSLVATLATMALGAENILGVSLPSSISSQDSKDEAKRVAQNLGIEFQEISIAESVESFRKSLSLEKQGLAYENLQARVRGVTLMGISNSKGPLLLATGNKSELAMGYSTLYGDLCGALLPIGDLYKTEVYGLAHYINSREKKAGRKALIPDLSLFRAPTAELSVGQKDSDSLPPYEILDTLLFEILENQGQVRGDPAPYNEILALSGWTVDQLKSKISKQEFKRFQAAPILKVHGRSFGAAWQMPIAKGF